MTDEPQRPMRFQINPAFRAAQHVAAHGDEWTQVEAPPEGEVLWRDGGDQVLLTTDELLVYVNRGAWSFYTKRLKARPDLFATLRGEPAPSSMTRPRKPVIRER